MKKLLAPFLLFFAVACSEPLPNEEMILWDTWGIPHIYADSDSSLYYMMGYAQMKNHGDLILKLYGEARGKSAEYWGVVSANDTLLHQTGILDAATSCWDKMSADEKLVITAFAQGLNAYAQKYPDALDEQNKVVLPLTEMDVMYHTFRVFYLEFLISRNLATARKWFPGSNAWAINGTKTSSGNTMLLANPHLPWQNFWLFFEAHLVTKDNSLYGSTLIGFPNLGIAFNENLGWTHTVNTLDNVDFYEISLKDNQYLIDGEYRDFEVDSVRVGTVENGIVVGKTVVKKRSAYGMVLSESADKAVTVAWPNLDGDFNVLRQWRAMGEAQDMATFDSALASNHLPLFNVLYSDKDGNISYHFGGNIPKKNGDWSKWQNLVTATSSDELWDGFYEANEVPSYKNPSSGWIQNANDPPFTSTIPAALSPDDYASHIAPNQMTFRPQRSARLIMDAKDLTLNDFIDLKHNTQSELALRIQDDLEGLKALTEDSIVLAALEVLTSWDATFDSTSTGSVLFINLMNEIGTASFFAEPWSFDNPVQSPDGFKDPEAVLKTINKVARKQLFQIGSLSPAYGDLFRMKSGQYEYGANGGPGTLGLFRTMYFVPGQDQRLYPYHGDTYVCATEFGEQVSAKALISYGNASQPGNPHVGDQLELYAKKELRPVWFTRAEQEANLELIEKLVEIRK